MMSSTIRISLASALLALVVGTGVSHAGPPPEGGKKVTLTLANPEKQDRPSSEIAEAFAARVKALTKGRVVVKVLYDTGRSSSSTPNGQAEASLMRLVRSGRVQLAIVPTRSFAAQGVNSFQALQAPFLITSDTGMASVTTGKIAAELQSGLGGAGLTGLGLAPEGLRRAFGFRKPLVTVSDFARIKIRANPNKATWALFKAFGAKPVDLNGNAYDDGVTSGSVNAAESSLLSAGKFGLPAPASVAGNVAFFPKIDALVANTASLRGLTADQVLALRQAGTAARAWSLASFTEKRGRNLFCKAGGTVVQAPASAITALRAKAAPVLAEMRRDALTRGLLEQIGALRISNSKVASCSKGTRSGPSAKLIPEGVYRWADSYEELLAAGAPPDAARENAGTWTIAVTKNGYQSIHVAAEYPEWTTTCNKRKMYVRQGLVIIELRGPKCGGNFGVAWEPAPDGIRITRWVEPSAWGPRLMTRRVLKKIG
jgi:TRAP-type C4-dicarboxylate transport system substrate-binding protein